MCVVCVYVHFNYQPVVSVAWSGDEGANSNWDQLLDSAELCSSALLLRRGVPTEHACLWLCFLERLGVCAPNGMMGGGVIWLNTLKIMPQGIPV